MAKGGARPGAGRPAGLPNRKTAELVASVAASGLTPLDYMLSILRDTRADPVNRMDMAKAAAPYCHARLVSTEVKGDPDAPVQHEVRWIVVDPKTGS